MNGDADCCATGVAPIRTLQPTNAEYTEELHAENAEKHIWIGFEVLSVCSSACVCVLNGRG